MAQGCNRIYQNKAKEYREKYHRWFFYHPKQTFFKFHFHPRFQPPMIHAHVSTHFQFISIRDMKQKIKEIAKAS